MTAGLCSSGTGEGLIFLLLRWACWKCWKLRAVGVIRDVVCSEDARATTVVLRYVFCFIQPMFLLYFPDGVSSACPNFSPPVVLWPVLGLVVFTITQGGSVS